MRYVNIYFQKSETLTLKESNVKLELVVHSAKSHVVAQKPQS